MSPDVVIIGAGIVGAACALALTRAGQRVLVLDRRGPVAGTTGAGEGNILLSDKGSGPELDLALRSRQRWVELAVELGPESIEAEFKGGLVVAWDPESLAALSEFAAGQRQTGVAAEFVANSALADLEPYLSPEVCGGFFYPQDMQIAPMLGAARLLETACAAGAQLRSGVEVTGLARTGNRVIGVETDGGRVAAPQVVNAAGTWAGEVSERLGAPIPVLPRRGFVLVTEALPNVVQHKVYGADYVANVSAGTAGLETSAVVEGTRSGTVLIGASRERVGFDHEMSVPAVRRLAAAAVRLFPMLAAVDAIRAYHGFRPYCPDHLPIIGPDPRIDGVLHAAGHEGAGIALATGTAELITAAVVGGQPVVDPWAFRVERFVA